MKLVHWLLTRPLCAIGLHDDEHSGHGVHAPALIRWERFTCRRCKRQRTEQRLY